MRALAATLFADVNIPRESKATKGHCSGYGATNIRALNRMTRKGLSEGQ